jgi:hypothetical protein
MADTYSKLLGLSSSPPPPSDAGKATPAKERQSTEAKPHVLANQQTSKRTKSPLPQATTPNEIRGTRPAVFTPPSPDTTLDTSLLTTKEKTKYGTYLTDESIEKISIRAIQLKRDAHQIVQEAVNQYFKNLEK